MVVPGNAGTRLRTGVGGRDCNGLLLADPVDAVAVELRLGAVSEELEHEYTV
jgi:hypothetical protein